MSLSLHDTILVDPVFFNEQWNGELCFAPEYLPGMMSQIRTLDAMTIEDRRLAHAESVKKQMHVQVNSDGIATVLIRGMMSKSGSSMDGAGSTVAARTAIRKSLADSTVKGIRLWIESGGGFAAGTQELYKDVWKAAQVKPLFVAGEDIVGSAAYWAAAGATEIWLNEAGRAGSIGSYLSVVDSSQAAAQEGLIVHRIRFGKNKGIGAEGVAITDTDLAVLQKLIDDGGQLFVQSVAEGRRVDPQTALSWATGETYAAKECLTLGLIDHIGTPEEALDALSSRVKGKVQVFLSTGVSAMKLSEIKAACGIGSSPSAADNAFLLKMAEREDLTELALFKEWSGEQKSRADARETEAAIALKESQDALAKANEELAKSNAAKSIKDQLAQGGNRVPKHGSEGGAAYAGTPDEQLVQEFMERVDAALARDASLNPATAAMRVAKNDAPFASAVHAANSRLYAAQTGA